MIHILIRYLGIKTKLLDSIKLAVDNVTPTDAAIVDIFAGSNIVGQSLMQDYTILTNDCQIYSTIAAKALIEHHDKEIIKKIKAENIFNSDYTKNKSALEEIFSEPLGYEAYLLEKIGDNYVGQAFKEFELFFNTSPYIGVTDGTHSSFKNSLSFFEKEEVDKHRANPKLFPYNLFTTYYNNPYFSLRQCVEIDSIRYSLDKSLEKELISQEEWEIYLSFLIYALHLTVISVGDHFAQPQKIKPVSTNMGNERDRVNLRERKKIITKKRTSICKLFTDKLNEYTMNYKAGHINNKAFNYEFKDFFKKVNFKKYNIKTIYIDPPYTNAHYSRFYHIPETLVLYDYPEIEFSGRYRTDRFQSGFCIKTQAYKEFDELLKLCKENAVNAIISYSNTAQCILTINDINTLCQKHYGQNVLFQNVDHMYRNFGQKPNKVLAKEYIITCSIQEA